MITKYTNCWQFVDTEYNNEKSSFDITRYDIITETQKLHKLKADIKADIKADNDEFLI